MTSLERRLANNYQSAAEMFREIEILMSDGDSAKEAAEHLLNGACVYTSAEARELVDDPTTDLDEDARADYQAFFAGEKPSLDCWGRVKMNEAAIFVDSEGTPHKQDELEWITDKFDRFCENFCLDAENPDSATFWQEVKGMMETHEPIKGWGVSEIEAGTYFIAYVL